MRFLVIAVLFSLLTGCANMLSAMSSMNEGMGAQCSNYEAQIAGFDEQVGDYMDGTYFFRDENEGAREENWLDGRMNYYLSRYTFGVYYETSPITNVDYKINVYCASYY